MSKGKVAVALSGGVDSGVSAHLLKNQGYDLVGFHMKLLSPEFASKASLEHAPASEKMAKKVAKHLDIPLKIVDYSAEFKQAVVDYFVDEYSRGRTPNPCVVCNKKIKFGRLLEEATSLSCDYLATGHYARIVDCGLETETEPVGGDPCVDPRARPYKNQDRFGGCGFNPTSENVGAGLVPALGDTKCRSYKEEGSPLMKEAADKDKDQSYFLWNLTPNQLKSVIFPLGDLKKKQARKIAEDKKLPVRKSKESFEICFLGGANYRDFLKKQAPKALESGEIVTLDGEVVGSHEGLAFYTIGQRKGLEVEPKKGSGGFVPALYVIGKDIDKNQLVVGRGEEARRGSFEVKNTNWLVEPGEELNCQVRIRLRGRLVNCQVFITGKDSAEVKLKQALWGITPGQSAVFYKDGVVLGGGVIS